MIAAQLLDGPCDGEHASVPMLARECWQHIAPGRSGGEVWYARYVRDPTRRNRFCFADSIVSGEQLAVMLQRHQAAGNTYGHTQGV